MFPTELMCVLGDLTWLVLAGATPLTEFKREGYLTWSVLAYIPS